MHSPLFSIARYLNTTIVAANESVVGQLVDLIGDKKTGQLSYILLKEKKTAVLYAVHYAYFRIDEDNDRLIFDEAQGDGDHDLFPDLPECYDDEDIHNSVELIRNVIPSLALADHRSDNESPF